MCIRKNCQNILPLEFEKKEGLCCLGVYIHGVFPAKRGITYRLTVTDASVQYLSLTNCIASQTIIFEYLSACVKL